MCAASPHPGDPPATGSTPPGSPVAGVADAVSSTPAALRGIRVLDFTRVLSGPFASMVLGDLGADVVKVEQPRGGDETRTVIRYDGRGPEDEDYFFVANRNKRSITIDLKSPGGKQLAMSLAGQADVLIENFSNGVMDRLGLSPDTLCAANPRLIYCSVSGFGSTGPYRSQKSYDSIIQAMSGVMSITGERGGEPVRSGMMIGDLAGSLYAVIGILAALQARERTGRGQFVDIGLLDSLISLLTVNAAEYLANGRVPQPSGSENPNRAPARTYLSSDDRYVQVLASTPRLWEAFCAASGLDSLRTDPRFATSQDRVNRRDQLNGVIAARFRQRPAAEWLAVFREYGVPAGLVQNLDEVFTDTHVAARGLVHEIDHPVSGLIRVVGSPLRLLDTPPEVRQPPPLLGQHTDEVLGDWLGYDPEWVERCRAGGAFG
ncbi:MAG: CaiB/BaiF CoA transferase family protein [Micromonosporaceae bacterium]